MKKSRYTASQSSQTLKEAETGVPIAEFCRKYEMGNATFYKWGDYEGTKTIRKASSIDTATELTLLRTSD